jgi:hypothetical protein
VANLTNHATSELYNLRGRNYLPATDRLRGSADNVCDLIGCQRVVAQAATMDPSIVGNYLEFQRQRIRAANEARALARKRMDEKFEREAAEARAILESTLNNDRELSPDESAFTLGLRTAAFRHVGFAGKISILATFQDFALTSPRWYLTSRQGIPC